jgi:hypothetical protein
MRTWLPKVLDWAWPIALLAVGITMGAGHTAWIVPVLQILLPLGSAAAIVALTFLGVRAIRDAGKPIPKVPEARWYLSWPKIAELEHETGVFDLYQQLGAEGHSEGVGDACRKCARERLAEIQASEQNLKPGEFLVEGGAGCMRVVVNTPPMMDRPLSSPLVGARVVWGSLDPVPEPQSVCLHPLNRVRDVPGPAALYRCLDCQALLTLGRPS